MLFKKTKGLLTSFQHIESELYSGVKGILYSQGGGRPASVTLESKSQNGNIKLSHKMSDAAIINGSSEDKNGYLIFYF